MNSRVTMTTVGDELKYFYRINKIMDKKEQQQQQQILYTLSLFVNLIQ